MLLRFRHGIKLTPHERLNLALDGLGGFIIVLAYLFGVLLLSWR